MTISLCFFILGETMTLLQIIGSIFIISILYITQREKANKEVCIKKL